MSMRPDHKALLFLATIAGLGAAVRAARAVGATPAQQPALERQMQAADSAKRTAVNRAENKRKQQPLPRRGGHPPAVPLRRGLMPNTTSAPHRDYRGRLDLDVASAVEIESLPAIGPSLARRIAADRMANGAFRELTALRRVKGITPKLLTHLDSLVSFSGIYKPPEPSDTILAAKPPKKR